MQKKKKKKEEEEKKKTTQARIFLMLWGKVTKTVTESVPTDHNFKREESQSGTEPRSFCLLGQQQQLWMRL